MVFGLTKIFDANAEALFNPAIRVAVNEGGTSSSKTFSILQLLVQICQNRTKPLLVSVVSESFPHLSAGAIRDFMMIMGSDFDQKKWNATNHIYTYNQGVQLEFFSADTPGKASGPRRDILFSTKSIIFLALLSTSYRSEHGALNSTTSTLMQSFGATS